MNPVLVIALIVLAILAILTCIVLVRTFALKPYPVVANAPSFDPGAASQAALERLSGSISFPTVSHVDSSEVDFTVFEALFDYLAQSFPLFHRHCELERVNTYALLYRWRAGDTAASNLKPLLFCAHTDVVPVAGGTEADWTHPPFSGAIADGCIWGRGAFDMKSHLLAYLEATETLLQSGFTPQRDIYFAFGFDEEVGGRNGAACIAQHLEEQGIEFELVLDEGGLVVTGTIQGVASPVAVIGVAEKGQANYQISFTGDGGHSSTPPTHTTLGQAAKLICAAESHPVPARLTEASQLMLANVAGEVGFAIRMTMANRWLFKPLLLSILAKSPTTNAQIRTTFAATTAKASNANNVLPQRALININARLLPGDNTQKIQQYLLDLAEHNGLNPDIQALPSSADPSPTSATDSPAFFKLERLIKEFYPCAIVTPYLMMGGTDSRKYYGVCNNIYRFTPILVTSEERLLAHNTDERISIENYTRMIAFFARFIRDYDSPPA
jgi:carboxypeptidase PM20D1